VLWRGDRQGDFLPQPENLLPPEVEPGTLRVLLVISAVKQHATIYAEISQKMNLNSFFLVYWIIISGLSATCNMNGICDKLMGIKP
jgi:hypothetical protein